MLMQKERAEGMKRTRIEDIYRMMIIQEHHYNKEEQGILDKYAEETGKTYKMLYEDYRKGITNSYAAQIGLQRFKKAAADFGISAAQAADAIREVFNKMAEALKTICEKGEGKGSE